MALVVTVRRGVFNQYLYQYGHPLVVYTENVTYFH